MIQLIITVGPTTKDYTRFLDGSSVDLTERINIPSQMIFNLEPIGSDFVLPPQRAYVQLYSSRYDRSLFTGYITSAPVATYKGLANAGQHFQYKIVATSDDYLLNSKAIPFIPAFVNRTQGQILIDLAETLCPGFFDTSMVASGDIVAYYQYDPNQSWSEVAKTFGDGSRYRYKVRDKQIWYQPYGDQPLGIVYDEMGSPGSFSPKDLITSVLAVPVVNDVTMVGMTEAGNNRDDYVIGSGFDGNVPLLHKVFRGASTVLVQESWNNLTLNLQTWFLQDPGDNFDFTAGALNIVAASGSTEFTLGDSYLQMNNGLEMAGGLDLEHGEFTFNDYCKGIIGGIYSDALFNASGLLGGFIITSPGSIKVGASGAAGIHIQPWWAGSGFHCNPSGSYLEVAPGATGTAVGSPIITQENHNYVLQTLISAPQYSRYQTVYRTVEGEPFGGAQTEVVGNVTFYVQDYDITQATGFFYQPQITQYTIQNVPLPAFVTYALINNQRMNLTDTNTLIATMVLGTLQAAIGPCGMVFPTGLVMPLLPPNSGWHDSISGYIGGVDASLLNPIVNLPLITGAGGTSASGGVVVAPPLPLSTGGYVQQVMGNGLLQLPAAQITPGNEADTLGFYSVSVPTAGSRIRLQTWEAQAAVSRLQDQASIEQEAFVVGDDGLRSAIVTNLNPLPRTSEDCDNAALAFLKDRVGTFYNGTYKWTTGPQGYDILALPGGVALSSDQQFWPTCGRFFNVNARARGIDQQKYLVTGLGIKLLSMVEEVIQWDIQFGADLYLEKVLSNFVDTQPTKVLLPTDTANPPNPRFTQNVDNSYLPDLTNVFCDPLGITELGVTVNVKDFYFGPIEVRRQDTNWGRGATPDLIATVMGPVFTLPRTQFDQRWYMRPIQSIASQGLCNTAVIGASGTSLVTWVGGSQQFNLGWKVGTSVAIGGVGGTFTTLVEVLSATEMVVAGDVGFNANIAYTVYANNLTSRRSKVLRVRYPLQPSSPLFVSFLQGLMQFNYNGDRRSIYGFELRTPPGSGTQYTAAVPITGGVGVTSILSPPGTGQQLFIYDMTFSLSGANSQWEAVYGPACSGAQLSPILATATTGSVATEVISLRQMLPENNALCFKVTAGSPNGSVAVRYGIAPADRTRGQVVLYQRPVASYADLNVDIVNTTPFPRLPAFSGSQWEFWAYFWNLMYGYSPEGPGIYAFANQTPGPASFTVAREGYGMLTINSLAVSGAELATAINFLCPSIDETDIGVYGYGSLPASGADPVTFSAFLATGSRYDPPVVIENGDYIGWNDPTPSNGMYSYEMNQIIGITGAASGGNVQMHLRRTPVGAPSGQGFFGSVKAAHTNKRFYRLVPKYFSNPINASGVGTLPPNTTTAIPEKWEFPWPNKCVMAVVSQCVGSAGAGPTYTLNLAPVPPGGSGWSGSNVSQVQPGDTYFAVNTTLPFPPVPFFAWFGADLENTEVVRVNQVQHLFGFAYELYVTRGAGGNAGSIPTAHAPGDPLLQILGLDTFLPPAPGLRTMNGAAYMGLTIDPVEVGATAAVRSRVQAWESIRTLYTYLQQSGGAAIVDIMYITPDGGTAALLDQLTITDGDIDSFPPDDSPDGRQMPYHVTGAGGWVSVDQDYPPSLLPVCSGALDVNGKLQLPITPSASSGVIFSPDGFIDAIVVGVTGSPGTIIGVAQT